MTEAEKDRAADALREAAAENDTAALTAQLDAGLPPDLRDTEGWTVLMWAAASGSCDAAKILLQHGADTGALGNDGITALMCAAATADDAMVTLLLGAKADPFLQNHNHETAGDIARKNGDAALGRKIDAVKLGVELGTAITVRSRPLTFKAPGA